MRDIKIDFVKNIFEKNNSVKPIKTHNRDAGGGAIVFRPTKNKKFLAIVSKM
jgi:hypothetical protein